ncbi:hypothetical protein E2C01_009928 [Portunus trituberculatus]|uniref:Uncharacterized protein n=1 Tax=Portunus trituberculatus TaxID=210409 RepID=A0A5B7D738_PORTR|nr:hypothetical protein [Portunus trituberculatus]
MDRAPPPHQHINILPIPRTPTSKGASTKQKLVKARHQVSPFASWVSEARWQRHGTADRAGERCCYCCPGPLVVPSHLGSIMGEGQARGEVDTGAGKKKEEENGRDKMVRMKIKSEWACHPAHVRGNTWPLVAMRIFVSLTSYPSATYEGQRVKRTEGIENFHKRTVC